MPNKLLTDSERVSSKISGQVTLTQPPSLREVDATSRKLRNRPIGASMPTARFSPVAARTPLLPYAAFL